MPNNLNVETVLTQQFANLTIGSSSATPINLPQSLIEPMNLSAATSFFAGINSQPNANSDIISALKAASTGFLPGFLNPAYLRMNLHFEGTNLSNLTYGNEHPLYNSNTSTAKSNIANFATVTPPALFTGGTPTATTEETVNPSSLAFDGNNATFWASNNAGIIPNAIGTAVAATNYLTGAAAIVTGNGAGGSLTSLHVGSTINMFDGNPSTSFEWFNGIRLNASNVIGSGTVWTVKVDFGVVRGLKGIVCVDNNGDAGTWSWSNDDSIYTTFSTQSMVNGTLVLTGVPASARYIRFQTGVGSGSHSTQIFYHFDGAYSNQDMFNTFDLSSGDTIIGTNYSIVAPTAGKRPTDWKLQGSNNGTAWTDLDTVVAYAGSWPFAGSFVNSTAYRYYRVDVTNADNTYGSNILIQDIKVWNSAVSSPNITAGTPQILKYDCGLSLLGTRYTVSSPQNNPVNWQLEASNNNSTWIPMHTVTAYAGAFPVTNTFTNVVPYRYWRLVITSSKLYSDVVTIGTFYLDVPATTPFYDSTSKQFGTTSAKLRNSYLTGSTVDAAHHVLNNLDFRYSCFYNFDAGFPSTQGLFSWGNANRVLDILKTASGLDVKYSTDAGASYTTLSCPFAFTTGQWYWIAVGRSGNTLHVNVDGVDIGTATVTGLSIGATAIGSAFRIGLDGVGVSPFCGNIDEAEMWINNCPAFTLPTAARTTADIPAVTWTSGATYFPNDQVEIDVELFLDTAQYSSFGVPDIGTDAFLHISLDNGVSWQVFPLVRDGSLTINTRIYRGYMNVDGIPSTNQLKYRLVSAAGKVLKFDGIIFYWQDAASLALTAEMIWEFPVREITGGGSGGSLTAEEIWEYANRTLTDIDAVKLTDIIPHEADLPDGPLTVKQVLEVIAKRLKRHKNTPKI